MRIRNIAKRLKLVNASPENKDSDDRDDSDDSDDRDDSDDSHVFVK